MLGTWATVASRWGWEENGRGLVSDKHRMPAEPSGAGLVHSRRSVNICYMEMRTHLFLCRIICFLCVCFCFVLSFLVKSYYIFVKRRYLIQLNQAKSGWIHI